MKKRLTNRKKRVNLALPNSLEKAHELIMEQSAKLTSQSADIGLKEKKVIHCEKRIRLLEEMLRLERAKRYGRSAEQYVNPNQACLFDEEALKPEEVVEEEEVEVPRHKRKVRRGKRSELPSYLERVRVEHTLPEAELVAESGEQYVKIGEVVSEQLDIIPATVRVIQNVRFKYAVKNREELGVKIAPLPKQVINKGIATPGLLAHVAQAKYCYHLPLYRQEQIWKSLDVELTRNSLCRWMMQVGEALEGLVECQLDKMKEHRHLHIDETPVSVLKQKDRPPDKKSGKGYMWVYVNHLGVVYEYQNTRHGRHPEKALKDYKGYVQTDAYPGYHCLFLDNERQAVGCMAHARRKYIEVQKAKKKAGGVSGKVLKLIGKLYKLEAEAKKQSLNEEAVYRLRQEKAVAILDELEAYLKTIRGRTPPKGLLGKAISYSLKNWEELKRYTEDGAINIDNNPAERAIKPFVIGRKNWMFCGNERGARAAANIYSMIESAKKQDLKIFEYLKYVLEELPKVDSKEKLEKLLPANIGEECPRNRK